MPLHEELQPGLKYSYEIAPEDSQENQNGAKNTIVKIVALLLSQFGLLAALNV